MAASSPSPTPPLPRSSDSPSLSDARGGGASERDRFEADELAIVLSHYDLPVIRRVRPYERGSRRSPKVRVDTELARYLLKRRAVGRDDARRVTFAHALHERLQHASYPVPALMPTRTDGSTLVRLGGRIYELFAFVDGRRDDGSSAAAAAAGAALARFHHLLSEVPPDASAPLASYHAAPALEPALAQVPQMVKAASPSVAVDELARIVRTIADVYADAGMRVDELGFGRLPTCILHGDWHPGNLLYRDGVIVGVLDLDSVRCEPRVIDLANALLQFSMAMPQDRDPREWPERLSSRRMAALMRGYRETTAAPLHPAEFEMVPWLMIEALVLEAVVPIAATGRFSRIDGAGFLEMVARKLRWIAPRAQRIAALISRDADASSAESAGETDDS